MKKTVYIIDNLDCANCAAKIEARINQLPQVQEATITFATRQLRITAEDPDALIPEILELAAKIEPGVTILPRDQRKSHGSQPHHHDHDHGECGCGHHHDHEHEGCGCGHHHDHEHEGCGCGHHHDHEHEGCGCGHHHEHDHEHEECCCGHHHDHDHEHEHEHKHGHEHGHKHGPAEAGHAHSHDGKESWVPLAAGAGLFVAGLVLGLLDLKIPALLAFCGAYLILGFDVLKTAAGNLIKGRVMDENFLMSVATLGAFAIGEFAEAVGVMLFYRVGEYFEHRAVERSRSQIMEAVDLRPETVTRKDGDRWQTVPAEDACVGDVLLVRPGDRIPLDGRILSGSSRIDTAPITGEPVPVSVGEGQSVMSGCVNLSGQLLLQVEKPLSESMVTRILDSVENAAAGKPKIDRFITRFARIYTPVVVGVAAFVAIVPSIITGNWNYWVYTALSFLVMSCPCALVLSVPLAFFSGIGVGSKQGILFKGGMAIEALAGVRSVALDKTGTLTKGEFSVRQVNGGDTILAMCASCEQYSTHPIAVSIVTAAKEQGLSIAEPSQVEELSGRGIRAVLDGKTVLCGNRKLMEEQMVSLADFREDEAGTVVLVAADGKLAGSIRIDDCVKPEAAEGIRRLQKLGVTPVMLTGDGEAPARAVAKQLGIGKVFARLLPGDKLEKLQQIRADHGRVMFVGDGINDAPVLAGADVGAAMGSGADAAIEAADVVFMTSGVDAVAEAVSIARSTRRIALENVWFALAVKLIVMVLGLAGFASMWLAVFADSGTAMLCVLNSIRLLYRKK